MITKYLLTLLAAGLLAGTGASAQSYEAALNKHASALPVEKLYLHYDKDYYFTGETIWFKAYVYADGKPSALAGNLYLQLADSRGRVIRQLRFPVLGAVAKGDIEIPDSLPQGNYYIRALTPSMLNGEEEFIYKKNIFIYNKPAGTAPLAAAAPNVSLQFFPESGQLVDGILTVTAFKATDQWGTPVDLNGVIRSEDGTAIASFKTFHDGIGKVQFKPQAGKKYLAEVETPAGKRTYALPEVKAAGINLKIQDEKGGKKFQLSRGEKNKMEYETVILVAQMNNHVIYETEIGFENYPSVIGHLQTDSLPSGILHFTVFNRAGLPLCERLSFVNNREYASEGSITATQVSAAKRAENSLELSFPGIIQRSCSVSITDATAGSFPDQDNIWSRFLLTSDLKGYIYNPAWYFAADNDSTRQGMDNLLLTHGWSRFNWTKIMSGEVPVVKYADQPLISISGKVTDEQGKNILAGGVLNIFLEAADSSSQNLTVPVDAAGRFRIDSLLFRGKAKLYYAWMDTKGKARPALVTLDENSMEQAAANWPAGALEHALARDINSSPGKEERTIRQNYVQVQLDEIKELERVTVQAVTNKKPIDAVNEKYTTGVFKAPGKVNLDNINDPVNDKSMNAVDYIKNRIQQLEIQNNRFVNRKNMSLMTGQKWAVGIFLNEMPTDIFQLRILRAMDIALVKFYEAGFVGVGSSFPGGAIAVYTKEKSKEEEKPDKLSFAEYAGYAISKEFYKPDYANKEIRQPVADNRTTLYWNPDIYTDETNSSVKISFFNNDSGKRFKVVVEGFDAEGKLVHLEKMIEK